jgi:hypothetical protein
MSRCSKSAISRIALKEILRIAPFPEIRVEATVASERPLQFMTNDVVPYYFCLPNLAIQVTSVTVIKALFGRAQQM